MTIITAPMLDFFTAEPDTTEVECQECGRTFEVSNRQTGRAKYCPDCRPEIFLRKRLDRYYKERNALLDTGDPATNLAKAVIEHARFDAARGNDEAKEFLVDGAELWIRACGIEMRPSYLRKLRNLRMGSENDKDKNSQ